jgi:hypothetical protein
MTERGVSELRPLRKVIHARFVGATSRMQLTLECGHEIHRWGWRASGSNQSYPPRQCRCDECPRRAL